jgi:hypothetical protein
VRPSELEAALAILDRRRRARRAAETMPVILTGDRRIRDLRIRFDLGGIRHLKEAAAAGDPSVRTTRSRGPAIRRKHVAMVGEW